MREIKFRAWDYKLKKMCRVASIDWQDGTALIATRGVISYNTRSFNENYNKLLGELELCELLQYTGMKDKNGREIWEGDIVKQTYSVDIRGDGYYDTLDGNHTGEVVITGSKGACIRNPIHYSEDEDKTEVISEYKNIAGYRCEVIGNKFDNPDLLKVGAPE